MEKKTCNKCNEEKPLKEFYYHRTRKVYAFSCRKCNSESCKIYQNKQRTDASINFIMSTRAAEIRRGKKNTEIPVAKNLGKLLIKQFELQNGNCYYSGVKMTIRGFPADLAMTVDRIVPEKGYVEGNIVLCCAIVNKIKTSLTINELFEWIKKIKNNLEKTQPSLLISV